MELGADVTKNLTSIGIVLSFLGIISTILLGIVVFFIKDFMNGVKNTRVCVEDHEVQLENHEVRITSLEDSRKHGHSHKHILSS